MPPIINSAVFAAFEPPEAVSVEALLRRLAGAGCPRFDLSRRRGGRDLRLSARLARLVSPHQAQPREAEEQAEEVLEAEVAQDEPPEAETEVTEEPETTVEVAADVVPAPPAEGEAEAAPQQSNDFCHWNRSWWNSELYVSLNLVLHLGRLLESQAP